MTERECREKYGEAHDAHMALNGECPWCGFYDPSQGGATVEEVVRNYG